MTLTELSPSATEDPPASHPPATPSDAPPVVSGAAHAVSETPKRNPTKHPRGGRLTRSQKWTAGFIVIAALTLAGIGLYLSFEHVAGFAFHQLHFGSLGKGQLFAVGVDTGIMVMIAVDLLMAWLKRPIGWIRYPVWLLTGATVILNAASGVPRGRAWELLDYVAAFAHGVVPILFIMIVELGRTAIDRVVRPAEGNEKKRIPLVRWILAPRATWGIFRCMKLWGIDSYPEMTRRQQALLAYTQWLKRKYDGDLTQASDDERLPETMAPYGYTVAEALAMPDEQDRAAEERAAEAERRRLEAETASKVREAAAKEQQAEADGKLATTHARISGETATAQAQAQAQVTAAERAAEVEAEALETARTAEARARTAKAERQEAEDRKVKADLDADAAELERQTAEKRRATEQADQVAASQAAAIETADITEARQRAAEAERRTAEEQKATAEAEQATAEAEQRKADAVAAAKRAERDAATAEREAAEARAGIAEIELRAVEMEDTARLLPRERAVRKVARMILHHAGGDASALTLEAIKQELGVSSGSTASEYRQEADALLAGGYRLQAA